MEKRSIDIVRQIIMEKREKEKDTLTPEQMRALDRIINLMNENDFFFLTIPPRGAAKLFAILHIEEDRAIKLYRDLVSKENKRKYKKYRREQEKKTGVSFFDKILKR